MDAKALRALLGDRNWVLVLPAPTSHEQFEQHSYINNMLIAMFIDRDIPTCHAALFDSNGQLNPAFFMWDPTPGVTEKLLKVEPLIYLTPKVLVIRGQEPVYPDFSSLELEFVDHKQIDTIFMDENQGGAVTVTTDPEKKGVTPTMSFYRDGKYRNCFFLLPKPFPKPEVILQEVETLSNIRAIYLDTEIEIVKQEAKNKKFTPRTLRVRKLMLDVITKFCPYSAQFGFQYNNKEGQRV